ncbi:MAG: hypothetical protein ACYC6A_15665 [Armatimonadota bacterium]
MRRIMFSLSLLLAGLAVPVLLLAAGKPAPGTHPVIDVGMEKLFGGSVDGKWLGCDTMMPKVKGGERYRLYTATKCLGDGMGGKATTADNGPALDTPQVSLQTKAKLPKDDTCVIGICGTWNALPRVPKAQSTKQQVYIDAVKAILKQNGLGGAPVNITKLLRIDLEGDGTEEVLISATTPRKGYPDPSPRKNDYSMLILRKVVKGKVVTVLLNKEFYTKHEDFAAPSIFTIDAVLDINGDGVMEVITGWRYYEGIGRDIFEIKGTKVEGVIGWGVGS